MRAVAAAIARRNLTHAFKNPALLLPSLIFPLIFLTAFAGGLSKLGDVKGFGFPSGYTAFQFVFVFIQSAAFSGIFTGFGLAADFESGFTQRLLLAASNRPAIILGYLVAAAIRFLVTNTFITVVALISGMQVDGRADQLVGLVLLGLLVNASAVLWGAGVAMRLKSLQAGPLMQTPVFVLLFLAPVYVPLHLLKGWLHAVARYNPATAFLDAGRGFISGEPTAVLVAYACGLGMVTLFGVWAIRGLRRVEAGS